MLRFLIDEDCPLRLEALLAAKGYDAIHVKTAGLAGTKDAALFVWAQTEKRIIISRDMGWANIITYPLGTHVGLIVLRLPYESIASEIATAVENFFNAIDVSQLPGGLVIVEKNRFRLRVDVL